MEKSSFEKKNNEASVVSLFGKQHVATASDPTFREASICEADFPVGGWMVDGETHKLLTPKIIPSLKPTARHLKMDGWNTIGSFWGPAYFQVRTVSFRECNLKLEKRIANWAVLMDEQMR